MWVCTYANRVATSFAFPENRYVLFYLLLVGCSQFLFRFLSPYRLVRFQFVHRFYSNEVFLLLTCENFNAYTVSESYVCENGLLATIQYIRWCILIWFHGNIFTSYRIPNLWSSMEVLVWMVFSVSISFNCICNCCVKSWCSSQSGEFKDKLQIRKKWNHIVSREKNNRNYNKTWRFQHKQFTFQFICLCKLYAFIFPFSMRFILLIR